MAIVVSEMAIVVSEMAIVVSEMAIVVSEMAIVVAEMAIGRMAIKKAQKLVSSRSQPPGWECIQTGSASYLKPRRMELPAAHCVNAAIQTKSASAD